MVDPLLMTAARVITFTGQRSLTNASGFFFARDDRLYLVTSRHVIIDEASGHHPDRIEIELHTDAQDLGKSLAYSIPLYDANRSNWYEARDSAGSVDVAAIEIDRDALPEIIYYNAFTPENIPSQKQAVEVGQALLVVCYPLGFHDTLHHLPIVRHAVLASSYGLRFQGSGYFLTDGRTHRGTSGAPVVMRNSTTSDASPLANWTLLGVHSARLDVGSRDMVLDEALGLNCSWYTDILMTLTKV